MTITQFEAGGHWREIDADTLCARIDAARLSLPAPFAAERVELVAAIADAILKRKGHVSPGIRYLGFWTRRAALRQLEQGFEQRCPPATLARPRGAVFHLPPRNVETIFLYSWILSYLAGNANVVRLPTEIGGEVSVVLEQITTALAAAGDQGQMFVRYPADDALSARLCARSDARVVWGGDAKIAAFERMPLRNGGKSVWFGDRSSLCVLDGSQAAALDEAGTTDLAQRLANDVFQFDQMACSSPQALYVVGTAADHLPAITGLLEKVAHAAAAIGGPIAAGHQIAKIAAGFSAAASGEAAGVLWRDAALTSVIAAAPERAERRIGGGFLSVVFLDELADLNALLRDRDQTITHFGFAPANIQVAAERNLGPGVSRWAPIGSALEFDAVWDGYDILMETTRLCRVG